MNPPRARPIPAERVRSKIRQALASTGQAPPIDLDSLVETPLSLVRSLPDWVGRFGILRASDVLALWCEARAGGGETFPSQLILDLPVGRYLAETLDVRSRQWISRESAAGGPLVAGLPFTGFPILVWIKAFVV
jgi:hypothetical protein